MSINYLVNILCFLKKSPLSAKSDALAIVYGGRLEKDIIRRIHQ